MIKALTLGAGIALAATSAQAAMFEYSAFLDVEQSTVNEESDATGTARLVVDDVDRTLDFMLDVTSIFIADFAPSFDEGPLGPLHIHVAPREDTGPVVIPFPRPFTGGGMGYIDTTDGFILEAMDYSFDDAVTLASDVQGIEAPTLDQFIAALDAEQYYVNIHTIASESGEIRGQLSPVPLPAGALLILGAFGALAAFRRKA